MTISDQPIETHAVAENNSALAALDALLNKQALYRLPFITILTLCAEEQPRALVEAHVNDLPDMAHATRTAASLVESLIEHAALTETILADGILMTRTEFEESLTGNAPEEYDDVESFIATTEIGLACAKHYSASAQLAALLDKNPTYRDLFIHLLRFCQEPKTLADVKQEIESRGYQTLPTAANKECVYPAFLLEQLQQAGAVVWTRGWETSKEAKEALECL